MRTIDKKVNTQVDTHKVKKYIMINMNLKLLIFFSQ